MSSVDASPSTNGRCSDTWHRPWTHLRVERRSPAYCRVTFDHPPVNMITARTVAELAELIELIEQDEDLKVVVFASANPAFFLSGGPVGPSTWNDDLVRLSRAAVVSIAAVRGCVCGAGCNLVLACDLRLASRDNTLLRVVADDQLDDEVEAMASRLAHGQASPDG